MPRKRMYHNPERSMVFEWCQKNISKFPQWKNVRLGPFPKGIEDPRFGVLRSCADLVYHDGKNIHIVEFKIKAKPEGIGELLHYKEIFPATPEFSKFRDTPIILEYVVARHKPAIKSTARKLGILYHVYTPPWLSAYMNAALVESSHSEDTDKSPP